MHALGINDIAKGEVNFYKRECSSQEFQLRFRSCYTCMGLIATIILIGKLFISERLDVLFWGWVGLSLRKYAEKIFCRLGLTFLLSFFFFFFFLGGGGVTYCFIP